MTRVGLDTNVLAYLAGVERSAQDGLKVDAARTLLSSLKDRAVLVAPVQTLGELFVVLTRSGASRDEAREVVLRFHRAFSSAASGEGTLLSALDCAAAHRLQLWDSLILTAAAEAGCALLLSEDMQPGFSWRGTVIVDPFAPQPDRRLATLLA